MDILQPGAFVEGHAIVFPAIFLLRVSRVNYFFALTTIISPGQRQLPFNSSAARSARRRAEGKARPRLGFST
jgi:hypothetical protein